MSKCVAIIPVASIARAALVEAAGRSMAQVKQALGCTHIINSWFYNMSTGRAVGNLKINGTVKANAGWNSFGIEFDAGPDIRMAVVPPGGKNYMSGVELLTPSRGPDAKLNYNAEYGGARGRSAVMLAGDYLVLYCTGDGTRDAKTPEGARDELVEIGGQYTNTSNLRALGMDSGGSSQCDFDGQTITSARRVAGYLCIWTKQGGQKPPEKEDDNVSKIVCLDPGHGPDTVNGSPDGSYKEKEFTWDMYQRIKPLLEARGISVVGTRKENEKPSLAARAQVSNKAGADCFVSLHSNAVGDGSWADASGLMIYTSRGPMSANRNVLATDLINDFHAAGVVVRSSPILHEGYTVLVETDAPACLIEYGFHTNKGDVEKLKDSAYRDTLAQATAKGICEYLGVTWAVETPSTPLLDAPDDWAADSWEKAKVKGILDGTRPRQGLTRQELAVVLDRLGLLD